MCTECIKNIFTIHVITINQSKLFGFIYFFFECDQAQFIVYESKILTSNLHVRNGITKVVCYSIYYMGTTEETEMSDVDFRGCSKSRCAAQFSMKLHFIKDKYNVQTEYRFLIHCYSH